jgi:hypothetical protein
MKKIFLSFLVFYAVSSLAQDESDRRMSIKTGKQTEAEDTGQCQG